MNENTRIVIVGQTEPDGRRCVDAHVSGRGDLVAEDLAAAVHRFLVLISHSDAELKAETRKFCDALKEHIARMGESAYG
ncbi:MAG: hypothetical protein IJ484_07880 [Oscillospiraceae bacterium]|nr:hypothetical protein [Oscillospiraceae bacterium]